LRNSFLGVLNLLGKQYGLAVTFLLLVFPQD